MRPATSTAPPVVFLLADNLDAALAAGEDLLKTELLWAAPGSASSHDEGADRSQRAAIDRIRSIELMLLARVLKSRSGAEELARLDGQFKAIAKLYVGGTALLSEAVQEFADPVFNAFETGDSVTAYLRMRGVIAPDAAAPADSAGLAVTEEFLVAGRVRLGALLDVVAMFLDTLETQFDLYAEPAPSPRRAAALAEATL